MMRAKEIDKNAPLLGVEQQGGADATDPVTRIKGGQEPAGLLTDGGEEDAGGLKGRRK